MLLPRRSDWLKLLGEIDSPEPTCYCRDVRSDWLKVMREIDSQKPTCYCRDVLVG